MSLRDNRAGSFACFYAFYSVILHEYGFTSGQARESARCSLSHMCLLSPGVT